MPFMSLSSRTRSAADFTHPQTRRKPTPTKGTADGDGASIMDCDIIQAGGQPASSEPATKPRKPAQLERTTFATSRLLDFCSEKELTAQIGHDTDDWPLVVLKELIDNALDACEEANVAPEIAVKVDLDGITISDNGPGIPGETITGAMDYSVKVSNREAYVAPDRGAQGNALKTLLAMPFVLDGNRGRVDVAAHGERREITFKVDPIRQEPVISVETKAAENVKNGTSVKLWWPDSANRRALEIATVRSQIGEITEEAHEAAAEADIPDDLLSQIKDTLDATPSLSWDLAVARIAAREVD